MADTGKHWNNDVERPPYGLDTNAKRIDTPLVIYIYE
jgi:hypothetical protein